MSTHVADRIMAALETQLATVTGIGASHVFMQPLVTLVDTDLPALIVEDFEDAVISEVGFFPVEERHELSFSVFVCNMVGKSTFRSSSERCTTTRKWRWSAALRRVRSTAC